MIILRALPLSIGVFFRFLPIAPVLAIVIGCYFVFAGLLALVFSFISPPISILLLVGISLASWVVPTMVGSRIALQSLGVTPSFTYGELLMLSVMYGAIEGILNTLIWGVVLGGVLLMTPVGADDMIQYVQAEGEHIVEGTSDHLVTMVFLITGIGYALIRSLLLVPLAAAANGRDPDGSFYTPLKNFGAGLIPLLVLSGLSAAIYYGAAIIAGYIVSFFTLTDGMHTLVFAVATYSVMLFGLSLQCAGAALVFMKLREQAEEQAAEEVPRMAQEDVRDLWKSRMPGGGGR